MYWSAFHDLSTERQIGMGVGPIPVSKIHEYAEQFGLSSDEADRFEVIIRRLDDAYCSSAAPQRPGEAKMRDEVSIEDGQGVRNLLRRLAKPKPSGEEVAK